MKKPNHAIVLVLALSVIFSAFSVLPSAETGISVGENQISDELRREYVNELIEYHLSENGERIISESLKNGKSAVFFFEGASDNALSGSVYSDYEKYRFSSVCIVVRLVGGKPKIVFFDDFCSTLPDHPRNAVSYDDAIATLVDGVYPIINCNHFGYAALHIPAYNWGTSVLCSKTDYYTDACYGINIHNRDTDSLHPNSKNSLGCILVGKNASNSDSYNNFMFEVTGIKNARSNSFDKVSEDCGCVIIDRALYKNELLKIYDTGSGDKLSIVNQITAYTNKINSSAKRRVPTGDPTRESRSDLNGDGVVNTADAIHLLRHVMFPARYPISQSGDMNGDDTLNTADAIYLLRLIMRPVKNPLAENSKKTA